MFSTALSSAINMVNYPNSHQGDGMWNPAGFGTNCDEIVASLKKILEKSRVEHSTSIKIDPLAIIPNPRNSDVFILAYINCSNDPILGVVRMMMDENGKVAHTYYMSQATDATARALLKNPEP